MLDRISTLFALAILASHGLSNAQMINQIGDGQIQNQAPTATPTIQPASAPEVMPGTAPEVTPAPSSPAVTPASSMPYPMESASNTTLPLAPAPYMPTAPKEIPASLPGPNVPLYSANTTMAAMATGTGGGGGNTTVPTVGMVPSGGPAESGAPKEAGTSAPAVAGSGAMRERDGGMVMAMVAMAVGLGVVVVMG